MSNCERILKYIKSLEVESHHRHYAHRAEGGLPVTFCEYDWPDETEWVRLDDPRLAHASAYSDARVKRYAKRIQKGKETLPPIVLTDKIDHFGIIDGAHRIAAAKLAGLEEIEAFVGRNIYAELDNFE